MKINIKKTIIYFGIWAFVLTPILVSAQSGSGFQWGNLVPCGHDDPAECGPKEFFTLMFNVMTAIIILGIAFSSLVFAYAGFLYITARGNQEQIKKATKMFTNVGLGLFFALISYMVIQLITKSIGLNTNLIPIIFN
jgi:hypothetical protein